MFLCIDVVDILSGSLPAMVLDESVRNEGQYSRECVGSCGPKLVSTFELR